MSPRHCPECRYSGSPGWHWDEVNTRAEAVEARLAAVEALLGEASTEGNHIDGVSVIQTSRVWAALAAPTPRPVDLGDDPDGDYDGYDGYIGPPLPPGQSGPGIPAAAPPPAQRVHPTHPEWCMRDCGCVRAAGHDGACDLTGPLPKPGCQCEKCAPAEHYESMDGGL